MAAGAVALVVVGSGAPAYAQVGVFSQIVPASGFDFSWIPSGPKCVTLNDVNNAGSVVVQWNCNGHNDQLWQSRYMGSWGFFQGNPGSGPGVYQLINAQSAMCMSLGDSYNLWGNGTPADQQRCVYAATDAVPVNQLWVITHVRDGYYRLRPVAALLRGWDMCLDVRGGYPYTTYNGTWLQAWWCNGGTNQMFGGDTLVNLM
jgi:Ricin-type beta-trefoil lectin domain-like